MASGGLRRPGLLWEDGIDAATSLARCRDKTILWALGRLGVAWGEGNTELVLELVGTDGIEGTDVDSMRACFAGVVAQADAAAQRTRLVLVGPNVPRALKGVQARLSEHCALECHQVAYEDYAQVAAEAQQQRRVAFCFNAGFWGYDSWLPAVEVLLRRSGETPVVVTSYSETEADDDEDVVNTVAHAALGAGAVVEGEGCPPWYVWENEPNPYGSLVERPSSVSDEVLHDSERVFALRWKRG